MKIYLVLFQYSTDDCDGVDTQAFSTYEKAVERFHEIIENEKNPKCSWAANAFENGELQHNYELDCSDFTDTEEHELWWNLTCKLDSSFRKVTKQGAFPNENALLKLLCLRSTELYSKGNGSHVQIGLW